MHILWLLHLSCAYLSMSMLPYHQEHLLHTGLPGEVLILDLGDTFDLQPHSSGHGGTWSGTNWATFSSAARETAYVGYEEGGISPQCPLAVFCLTGSRAEISDSQLDVARVLRCLERHNWPEGLHALAVVQWCLVWSSSSTSHPAREIPSYQGNCKEENQSLLYLLTYDTHTI